MAEPFTYGRRGITGRLEEPERELLRGLFNDVIGMLERSLHGEVVALEECHGRGPSDREVALAARIAPRTLRVPMPRLHHQLGILAKSDRAPARGKNRLQCFRSQVFVDGCNRNSINSRTQGLIGNEAVGLV